MKNINECEEDEIVIDFNKIYKILWQRKFLVMKIFTTCLVVVLGITLMLPKKYETNADIYINKSNDTNLAELNPYILSTLSGAGSMASLLSGGGGAGLQNEMDIMESPLVMDNVIKDNNLRCTKGPRKGEFITTRSFLNKKVISIENKKGSNIISIAYKSGDPVLNYNIVNSIITNYQKVNAEINTKKALKDKKLLENSYVATNKTLNQKLSAMKNSSALPPTAMASLGVLNALRGQNRAIGRAVGSVQSQVVDGQKSQIAVDQEVDKLKMVKTKLEWTGLVEQMSKDTSNIIVLKKPEIKKDFEQSSPKLMLNLILGAILGVFASVIGVIFVENIDKTLSYSDLGERPIYNIEKNIDELKIILLSNLKEKISLVVFEGFDMGILRNLNEFINLKVINVDISSQTINDIESADKLIFAAKVGQTPKKLYKQIKTICTDSNKQICTEIIL